MKTNSRGEPARICWMCGGTRTKALDPDTRDCEDCGNHYAVFQEENMGAEQPKLFDLTPAVEE